MTLNGGGVSKMGKARPYPTRETPSLPGREPNLHYIAFTSVTIDPRS